MHFNCVRNNKYSDNNPFLSEITEIVYKILLR